MEQKKIKSAKAATTANEAEVQPEVKQSKVDDLFRLVKEKDGVKICIGNYLISRRLFKSWQEAEDYLRQKPYEIIINAACLCAKQTIENYEKTK